MKYIYLLMIVIGAIGCSQKEIYTDKQLGETKRKIVVKEKFDNFFKLDAKILLKTDDNFFNRVDEIFIHNKDIYIVDSFDAKNILHFNSNGNFENQIGSRGQGPGQYIQPVLFAIVNNNKVVYDDMAANFLLYNKEHKFIKKFSFREKLGFFGPYWFQVVDNFFVCFSPKVDDNGNSVFIFDSDLNYIKSFFADEKLMGCFHIGGLKNLAVDKNKHIWVSKIFTPEISILDFDGNVIKTIDLSSRDCFFDSSQVAGVTCGDYDNFYKKKGEKAYVNGVYALGDYVLVSYFYGGQLFDMYDLEGNLMHKPMLFKKKYQVFANVSDSKLIFYDMWSDEATADNTNGILYIYKIK